VRAEFGNFGEENENEYAGDSRDLASEKMNSMSAMNTMKAMNATSTTKTTASETTKGAKLPPVIARVRVLNEENSYAEHVNLRGEEPGQVVRCVAFLCERIRNEEKQKKFQHNKKLPPPPPPPPPIREKERFEQLVEVLVWTSRGKWFQEVLDDTKSALLSHEQAIKIGSGSSDGAGSGVVQRLLREVRWRWHLFFVIERASGRANERTNTNKQPCFIRFTSN